MDITIVVPLFNEEESLPELADWINRVCSKASLSYELIFVDDGSSRQFMESNRKSYKIKFQPEGDQISQELRQISRFK